MTVAASAAMILVAGCFGGDQGSELALHQNEGPGAHTEAQQPLTTLAGPANVLVFGDYEDGINALISTLTSLGHTVTLNPDFGLSADLTQFNTVWHVGQDTPLTDAQIDALSDYVISGGGLHLSGERSGAAEMNDTITQVLDRVVLGGGVVAGDPATANGTVLDYFPINSNALGGVSSSPNPADYMRLLGAGGMSGVPTSNVLATGAGGVVVAAVWDSSGLVGGHGALSVVMDSGWFTIPVDTAFNLHDNGALVENLQEAMNRPRNLPPVNPDPGGDRTVECDPNDNSDTVPVTLTGSATDPDGDPLTFTWLESGDVLATGATANVNLSVGQHTIRLLVSDGRGGEATAPPVTILVVCEVDCTPGPGLFTRCHPLCPCAHGEGDCDFDNDCEPGLVCLHDAGFAFGYDDNEVDVCSNVCPTLGVGAWNYCSPECPCDQGEGDCETDADCAPGLRCVSDIGPTFGFDREVDICEPI
ncbi:Ig-like domain-containing protein [Haliangium sp.]|uniref:Ig-like domain-containing protein n=1 Tax=Haliangium sp. TaxID=2663208 RepID=UPI003D120281